MSACYTSASVTWPKSALQCCNSCCPQPPCYGNTVPHCNHQCMLTDSNLMSLRLLLQSTPNSACNLSAKYSSILLMALSFNIWQVWNEDQADEEVLAMVVRTGLCTAMGDMLRQVIAPINKTSPFKDPFVTVRMFPLCNVVDDAVGGPRP